MPFKGMFVVVSFLATIFCVEATESFTGYRQLFLVSFDGFSYKFLQEFKQFYPNFLHMEKNGASVSAPGNIPPFFSDTGPGHLTALTGLHPENHGIVANTFYDPEFKEIYNLFTANNETKWYLREPIWFDIARNNLTSGVIYPLASAINNILPGLSVGSQSLDYEGKIDQALDWLEQGTNFVFLHFDVPDRLAHLFGEYLSLGIQMDYFLGKILSGLSDRNLTSKVNLIVFSDHGMTDVHPSRSIDLFDYIRRDSVFLVTSEVNANIWPSHPNLTEEIFANLSGAHPHMTLYRKEDLPDRCHCRNSRRIAPIVVMADEGWIINNTQGYPLYFNQPLLGNHGYDNILPSMRGIFLALGPDIRPGVVLPPFPFESYYVLMCRLLGIVPSPHDGSEADIESIFASRFDSCQTFLGNIMWFGDHLFKLVF